MSEMLDSNQQAMETDLWLLKADTAWPFGSPTKPVKARYPTIPRTASRNFITDTGFDR